MDWQPGQKVGAYRLLRLVGRGGMGEVYLARDQRLERQVALKRVRPDRLGDAGFRERFRREARLSARLNHPSIVQIFDLLEDPLGDGGDALVLEWVEGRPLAAILAEGPLDPDRLLAWGEAIARGLAAAHRQGLLHRDLKAGNVLVSEDGEPKILDFGLARPLFGDSEALTEGPAVLGTFASMSPEQARGEPLDPRSDLFSLGLLLYEMARGASPFRADSPYETLRRVQQEPAPPLLPLRPDLPPELAELIASLLEKDREARPLSAAAVAAELKRIAAGSGSGLGSSLATGLGSGSGGGSWPAATPDATTWAPGDGLAPPSLAPSKPPTPLPPTPAVAGRRGGWWIAAILALALAGGLAFFLGPAPPGPAASAAAPRLRVAVPPAAAGDDASSPLLLASIGVELQRGLLELANVVLFDAAQIGDADGPLAAARAVSADEVIAARLFREGGRLLLVLKRLRAADGSVLWAENLEIPGAAAEGDPGDALLTASAIRAALRRAYAGLPLRAGAAEVAVSRADYARFVEVRRRFDAGRRLADAADLDELEAIGASSPRFADAHILAAALALSLHRDSKDPAFLQRARRAIERGLQLGSDSPMLYGAAIRLALAEGNDAEAGELLARLQNERPGDPLIVDLESRRLESQGRIDAAIALRRREVGRGAPTWRELYFLADLEYKSGDPEEARAHLRAALERAPGNAWALDKLGQIELAYGSLAEAEKIFAGLAEKDPRRGYFTNLGLARFLAGRYDEAIAAYRQAAAAGGEHYALLLNQADAELARGRAAEARALYARALEQLENAEKKAPLAPKELTSKAQCLLQLGRRQEAVDLALAAFQRFPEEVEVQYHAALVLAAAGQKAAAIACARRAIELGFPPRWLELPAFAPLAAEPEFRALLAPGRGKIRMETGPRPSPG